MKLVFILGNSAVGKMTVGQELMKLTGLRLFHNHMMIEPVIEIFGEYNGSVTQRLRDVIFEEFAAADKAGMIFTYMMAFNLPSEWAYLAHVEEIFRKAQPDCTFYYTELIAPQEIRLARNRTENRLRHKASKKDLVLSEQRILRDDAGYRLESLPGEFAGKSYLRLDNSELSPEEAARRICNYFSLA